MDRLASVSDSGGYSRSFGYDAYGNAWVSGLSGIGYGPATPAWDVYSATTNQIPSSPYDASGNMLALPPSYTFTYDAENRQTSETNSGNPNATYAYDSDGKRVEKTVTGSGSTVYVYDASGQLAAEYPAGATAPSKEYIRFGEQLVAIENASGSPCQTCYLSYDHLGSVRMVTDQNANVVGRHDYLPFGEEIFGGWAGRDSSFGDADNVNQKFTGKERDQETGLDFFQARYYGSALGRFTSPDFGGPIPNQPDPVPWADLENPQSLNLYAYGLNNPLANVDDDGHDVNICTRDENGNQHCQQVSNEEYQQAQQGNNVGLNVPTLNQVGMNGNGSGGFNPTDITDVNGNVVGTATYVSNGGADYYANRNGLDLLATTSQTVGSVKGVAAFYGASIVAGAGFAAAGATAGELTLLGDISLTPTAGETAYAERLIAQGGREAVEKAINTLSKRLAEHQAKVGGLKYPGSIEREIAGFTRTIEALKQVLR